MDEPLSNLDAKLRVQARTAISRLHARLGATTIYVTRRGVNINVTLLFSIERYEQMIDAYLRGLDARAHAGKPLDSIASVASFFLSRIDVKVDARLPDGSALRGATALARARVAYQRYLARFAGPEWERLERAGARR